jgi:cation-transporting ATPase 13A3/4/5
MSVICKNTNKDGEYYYVYSKGSPEIMLTIMNKKSVPEDYQSVLKKYTSNGFRVLAIASKKTSGDNIKTITRDEA